jgi:hypothetical protein
VQKHPGKEPAFVPSCADPTPTCEPKQCQDWFDMADRG